MVAGITTWAVTSGSSRTPASSAATAPAPSAPTSLTGPSAPIGAAAPPFTLTALTGGQVSLAQLAGHPVVVNFWASWCYPCRQEFPLLRAALARHRRQGLEIVGISHQDIPSDARAFVRNEHATWTFLRDDDGSVADTYGVRGIPATYFIRPDGTLAGRLLGINSTAELETALRSVLPA